MTIAKNKVVSMHYTLKDDEGTILDSSEGRAPLDYIHGANNIVPGLEKELDGKAVGDKLKVTVSPEGGYGVFDQGKLVTLPKTQFGGAEDIQPGMQFQAQTPQGMQMFTVAKVEGDNVTVDGNHPLAGKTLNFDVSVEALRDATEEEISHGHLHQGGGCCGGGSGGGEGGGCGCEGEPAKDEKECCGGESDDCECKGEGESSKEESCC